MTTNTLRKEVQEYIKTEEKPIGYNLGKPIKKRQLLAELKEAESQIERGEFITIENLESESKTW